MTLCNDFIRPSLVRLTVVALSVLPMAIAASPSCAQEPVPFGLHAALDNVVPKDVENTAWSRLEHSRWLADGKQNAPRTVYVFTDPNCPFCNKLWSDARPWVDSGKVQLRHVMVGILTPTSAGKAAALLNEKDPSTALATYERNHVAQTSSGLASGRPRPLDDSGLKPLASIPAAIQSQLEGNEKLMMALGLEATPAMVWRDETGTLRIMQGVPDGALAHVFGPR